MNFQQQEQVNFVLGIR